MINYGKHYLDKADFSSVLNVLKNGNLTQGKLISKFESSLNSYFGSKYACVLSNATAGLYLLSELLKWKKKDLVFLSPLTFLAGANSVARSGATPFFVDIDPKNFNLDLNILETSIRKNINNVKAIIATDYSGIPCDWKSLRYLANKYSCTLINDNCHAMGSKYDGNRKYAVKYADFVVQSYHAVKNFTTGEGGSILTNNRNIYEKILKLRSHGIFKNEKILPWFYDMNHIGYNFRLTEIQASLGISQLKKLNKFIKKRRQIAKYYDNNFSEASSFQIPLNNNNYYNSYHIYPLIVNFKKFKKSKKDLFIFLKKKKINLQVHYIPTYKFSYYKKKFNFNNKNFPNCEKFYENEISLPIFYRLKLEEQKLITKSILDFLKK